MEKTDYYSGKEMTFCEKRTLREQLRIIAYRLGLWRPYKCEITHVGTIEYDVDGKPYALHDWGFHGHNNHRAVFMAWVGDVQLIGGYTIEELERIAKESSA